MKSKNRWAGEGNVKYKHGMSRTRINRIWCGMKSRCDNKNCKDFAYYGARGITYDPRWSEFENFLSDMLEGYEENLTLDRINNAFGYSKENCRWATRREQTINSSNTIITINGVKATTEDLAKIIGISTNSLHMRIHRKWDIEKMFTKYTKNYGK